MARRTAATRLVQRGDKVTFCVGARKIRATVVEDRGAIGVGGRRLVRIKARFSPSEDMHEFEVPLDDLELSAAS